MFTIGFVVDGSNFLQNGRNVQMMILNYLNMNTIQ